jgi:hypothetical protein
MTGLEVARGFVNAVHERDADAATELCIEAVEVLLPGADAPLRGKEGVRQMIRMAPSSSRACATRKSGTARCASPR